MSLRNMKMAPYFELLHLQQQNTKVVRNCGQLAFLTTTATLLKRSIFAFKHRFKFQYLPSNLPKIYFREDFTPLCDFVTEE